MKWTRPETAYHAHFDCFSGAAGDMLLATCLDASNDADALLAYVKYCLEDLLSPSDFDITKQRVHRGKGSIAALHVTVGSTYHHAAAPVPSPSHHHHDEEQQHTHAHDHETPATAHSHNHEHQHTHDSTTAESGGGHDHSHAHNHHNSGPLRTLSNVTQLIRGASRLPTTVQDTAIQVFTHLAQAEAHVHGAASIQSVHFHEVGAVDSIVDIVGTILCLHCLHVERVSCSRLPLGSGSVHTQHGLLPVPAPATLFLLQDMAVTSGPPVSGELVTPTAAALLKTVCGTSGSGSPPVFTLRRIGVGAGTKDFDNHPNIVRVLLGDQVVSENDKHVKKEEPHSH